ncbi:MAG: polysaccharide deacetylase family protein [bacterium]
MMDVVAVCGSASYSAARAPVTSRTFRFRLGALGRARSPLALAVLVLACADGRAWAAAPIEAGPRDCPQLALTFDLCPVSHAPGFEAALVQMLIERQVPATFFASGRWMAKHDGALRELLAVPFFEIGTHGARHLHLPTLAAPAQRAEIGGAVELLAQRFGRPSSLFRPPYGEYDQTSLAITEALGLRVITWDVVSGDPSRTLSAQHMWSAIESRIEAGSIVVFHANGNGHHTQALVTRMIDELAVARGWRFVTVSTLLDGCAHESDAPASAAGGAP